jgi:hypothetical protein
MDGLAERDYSNIDYCDAEYCGLDPGDVTCDRMEQFSFVRSNCAIEKQVLSDSEPSDSIARRPKLLSILEVPHRSARGVIVWADS